MGADGSGKSSLIDRIYNSDKSRFEKIHFVPSILKLKKNNIVHIANNKTYPPRNFLISFIKLMLWMINFKIFEIIKSKSKKIFLFDRGIHDILIDPKRYRYSLPINTTIFFLKFIKKPNYIIFLNGDPELIFKRKKEKSSEQIYEVSEKYKIFIKDYYNSITFDISDNIETNYVKAMDVINSIDRI